VTTDLPPDRAGRDANSRITDAELAAAARAATAADQEWDSRVQDEMRQRDALRPEINLGDDDGPDARPDSFAAGPCEACGARPAHRIPIKPEYAVARADVLLCGPCLRGARDAAGGAT
jgi:hypothetical protein